MQVSLTKIRSVPFFQKKEKKHKKIKKRKNHDQ